MKRTKYTSPEPKLGQMSMQELTLLRTQWINEARKFGDIEACIKVSRELGKTIQIYGWPAFTRWCSGELVVDYKIVRGLYLPASGRPSQDKILSVSWGLKKYVNGVEMGNLDKELVYFSKGDNLKGYAKRNVFLPGAWLERIHEALPAAEKNIEKKIEIGIEHERQVLLSLMTAGQEARKQ